MHQRALCAPHTRCKQLAQTQLTKQLNNCDLSTNRVNTPQYKNTVLPPCARQFGNLQIPNSASPKVRDVMTRIDEAFMLEKNMKLDFPTLSKIYISGCSRIPIYEGERHNVVGLLFVKGTRMHEQ